MVGLQRCYIQLCYTNVCSILQENTQRMNTEQLLTHHLEQWCQNHHCLWAGSGRRCRHGNIPYSATWVGRTLGKSAGWTPQTSQTQRQSSLLLEDPAKQKTHNKEGNSLSSPRSNQPGMGLHSPHGWRGCNCAHLSGTRNCWWDCHIHLWELSVGCAAVHRSAPEWRNGKRFWFWREPPSLK